MSFEPGRDYHVSWEPIIAPVLERYWPSIQKGIGQDFLPPMPHILRAFSLPLPKVKVVIVGQDPYPTPGHAMGLAFSTRPGVPAPRSLLNIYTEMQDDLGYCAGQSATDLFGTSQRPDDGDLSAWERQGVLLLNRVLTVVPGKAGAHKGLGWEKVTEAALRAVDTPGVVVVLWGKDAQQARPLFTRAHVLTSAHPSPLSARRGFFGSRPFSTVNRLLEADGLTPIDWHL